MHNLPNFIILTIMGILMGLRTWLYFNYLRVSNGENPVNIIKYINLDNNIAFNAWKLIPIIGEIKNPNAKKYKSSVNIMTYIIYVLIGLFIITL